MIEFLKIPALDYKTLKTKPWGIRSKI